MTPAPHALDLSVVIPVGPGDESWRELLPLLTGLSQATELIISACEAAPAAWTETADQRAIAERQWLVSEPGRAQQLNHGVERSRGRRLWLLHADSRPDQTVIDAVNNQIHQQEEYWHYFDLAFDNQLRWKTAFNRVGANLRSRVFKLPFGDQGWLISKTVFERVGLFDTHWVRGEDLEWAMRARHYGIRPVRIGCRLITSSRRYIEHGWLRTTLDHQVKMWRMIRVARRQHRDLA